MSCFKSIKDLDEFVLACHRAQAYGLLRLTSGNLSWRLDDKYFAISAKGSWLGELTKEDVAICQLSDGQCVNGQRCSLETAMHLEVLRNRSDVDVVLHFHGPCATAIACSDPSSLNFNIFPDVPYYIGKIGMVDYLLPGSDELAKAVGEVMKDHNLVLMRNHGQLTAAKDFNLLFQRAGFFEFACEILVKKLTYIPLTDQQIERLKDV